MKTKPYQLDTPTAVIGELAKRLQAQYGDDVLLIFSDVLKEYGRQGGMRLRKKTADLAFPERVTVWLEPFLRSGKAEVVKSEGDRVTIKGFDCPLNLEATNQALCTALMRIDEGLVSALAEKDITLKIEKSLACEDSFCLVTFSR